MGKKDACCLIYALGVVFWVIFPEELSFGIESTVVRVGHQPNLGHGSVIVAEEKGFSEQEGLII